MVSTEKKTSTSLKKASKVDGKDDRKVENKARNSEVSKDGKLRKRPRSSSTTLKARAKAGRNMVKPFLISLACLFVVWANTNAVLFGKATASTESLTTKRSLRTDEVSRFKDNLREKTSALKSLTSSGGDDDDQGDDDIPDADSTGSVHRKSAKDSRDRDTDPYAAGEEDEEDDSRSQRAPAASEEPDAPPEADDTWFGEPGQVTPETVSKLSAALERVSLPKSATVAITGVKFIMERDFPIWEMTLGRQGHTVVKTSKKKLAKTPFDYDVMWCLDLFDGKTHCIEPKNLLTLTRKQRISRLYGLRKTLWNKDRFCETMGAALEGFIPKREFVFPCWLLPRDYTKLMTAAKGRLSERQFILKPTDRGEGNGIVVFDNWHQLVTWKTRFPDIDEVVAQTYLPDPFLIDERKWDMRTYVLVTSVSPLRCYMFKDGLVRFASTKYDKNAKGGGKATQYLTNTSVNKKQGIDVNDLTWPFPKVYRWLKENGHDADQLWRNIEGAVAQMLLSAESGFLKEFKSLDKNYRCENCYQLLGVDVIVDESLTPRVIEVNGEPSMQLTGESGSHYDITKTSMTRDVAKLILGQVDGVPEALASDLAKVGANVESLSEHELDYLVNMKREHMTLGGFRRVYPSRNNHDYDAYVTHLNRGAPRKFHALLTRIAMLDNLNSAENAIDDPNYHGD